MSKYVRVMDGLKSNAGGFDYKLDEINISEKWDTSTLEPEKMGGFNFSTEDKILRWLHRGDTVYDVIVPEDAEIILCDEEKGIYRSNKIVITNPRPLTDEMILNFIKITTLSDKIIAQCIKVLLWKDKLELSKQLIKEKVNLDNINNIIEAFEDYEGNGNFKYENVKGITKTIYDILKEIQSSTDISLYVSKEPYIKQLTNDNVINLTGQSGSGKSYYAKENFNSDNYEIIDTDDVFSDKRYEESTGLNKKIGEHFRNKYNELPNLSDDFDLIYNEIIDYCKYINKTIVIDCAQFHCCKDISILKGKIIIIRTDIDTCYNRTIDRWIKNHEDKNIIYTDEELKKYKDRKKKIYSWYKGSNEFIRRIDSL